MIIVLAASNEPPNTLVRYYSALSAHHLVTRHKNVILIRRLNVNDECNVVPASRKGQIDALSLTTKLCMDFQFLKDGKNPCVIITKPSLRNS